MIGNRINVLVSLRILHSSAHFNVLPVCLLWVDQSIHGQRSELHVADLKAAPTTDYQLQTFLMHAQRASISVEYMVCIFAWADCERRWWWTARWVMRVRQASWWWISAYICLFGRCCDTCGPNRFPLKIKFIFNSDTKLARIVDAHDDTFHCLIDNVWVTDWRTIHR